MTASKSPDRNTFQKNGYLKRQAEKGKTPENDKDTKAMVEYYESWSKADEEWIEQEDHENDMEWDLRTTDWILEKVRSREDYAQNLYAAMCNNEFQKNEFMPRLAGKTCSYSWRYAGGIIADMRQEGDYIDWYCSGIRNDEYQDDEESKEPLTEEQLQRKAIFDRYVGESVVTEEIEQDLKRLGWYVIKSNDE